MIDNNGRGNEPETGVPQMPKRTTPQNIDAYISASPAQFQPILKKIRKTIPETIAMSLGVVHI
jgi:hypothetical protein